MWPDPLHRGNLLYAVLIYFAVVMIYPLCENASAGTADKTGTNADLYSITIDPSSAPTGSHPQLVGFVSNTSSLSNGSNGETLFDITGVVVYPNNSQISLLWKNVRFLAGQKKSCPYGTGYDTHQPGTYKITFSVYSSGKTHLYSSLSKTFTITAPQTISKPISTPPISQKRDQPPAVLDRPGSAVQPQPSLSGKPSEPVIMQRGESPVDRVIMGIGGHVNTINSSAGAALTLWPLRDLALQGTYGIGTFTSYEARMFYRIPLSRRINPYLGAGYLHTERKGNVIGIDTTISGDSYTAFVGMELQLYKGISLYADASGTPLKLRKDVTNGTTQATATVKYAPVTVNAGIVFYLF